MKFKIIGDSCCDLTKEELKKTYFCSVPLTLNVGEKSICDDENFNQKEFIKILASCPECPKSACPSPGDYMDKFRDAEDIYVVTLSAKLSGSYNSAMTARSIYLEENPSVNIHVFDSKSAAAGEHLICEKIEEYVLKGMPFKRVVEYVNKFIEGQNTIFVLENLDVLRKNGRLSKVKFMVANVLNIKPVLCGKDGEIHQVDQGRGMKKALNKLINYIEKIGYDVNRKVEITQCGSMERCKQIKDVFINKLGFKNVEILDAGGVSSMYENEGGVVISF